MSTTGTEIEENLREAETPLQVDKVFRKYLKKGDVPDYISEDYWKAVNIYGNDNHLELLVIPDIMAFGTDDDPFRAAKTTPMFAQECADEFDSILPSTKILRAIQKDADPKWAYTDVKVAPYNIPLAKIETHDALVAANNLANKLFDKADISPGQLNTTQIGYRKAIVVGPNLDGSKVAIYGGRWTSSGGIVQPYSTLHEAEYSDYSHGIVLISRKCRLNGELVDLRDDIFGSKDPDIYGLVIDLQKAEGVASPQVRFDPVFPNKGSGSKATFSVMDSGSSSSDKGSSGSSSEDKMIQSSNSVKDFISKNKKPLIAGAIAGTVGLVAWTLL